MGRLPRLQFAGACYRVSLRGNGGDPLFSDDADRRKALELLGELKARFQVRLYAWCLLDSRIELALETRQANLSRAMQGFGTAFTKYLNGRRRRTGHVFGGRYRSELVDKGEALAELTRAIHLLPKTDAAAGAVEPWRYQWSSCRSYTEGSRAEALVETDGILAQFGRSRLRQSVKYLKFMKRGGSGFRVMGAVRVPYEAEPAAVGSLLDLESEVEEAARRHGLAPEQLRSPLRSEAVCRARREVARNAWEAGVKIADIAAALRKTSAAVSRMVRSQIVNKK